MPETVSVAGFASKTTSRKDLARLIAWALIMVIGATLVMPESVRAGRKEDRAEVILSDLPSRSSNEYIQLLRLAGKDVRVQNVDFSSSETWSLAKARLEAVVERAEKLGATATVLDIDRNSLLKPPGDGLKKTGGQELVLEALKSSNETLVVGVMASLKGAAAEYALTRDAQGKVSATRPWCEGDHSFYREGPHHGVRKRVEKKQQGWTWRGEVEGTGEPVMLMWWKGGKFTWDIYLSRPHLHTQKHRRRRACRR